MRSVLVDHVTVDRVDKKIAIAIVDKARQCNKRAIRGAQPSGSASRRNILDFSDPWNKKSCCR